MKHVITIALMAALLLLSTVSCSGDKPTTTMPNTQTQTSSADAQEPGDEEFMGTALKSLTGLNIVEVRLEKSKVVITYEQVTDDSQTVLVQRWLGAATVAMSFMEDPRTIIIIPVVEGEPVAEVTIEAGDVASLLTGEMSLQETLSKIKIETPR